MSDTVMTPPLAAPPPVPCAERLRTPAMWLYLLTPVAQVLLYVAVTAVVGLLAISGAPGSRGVAEALASPLASWLLLVPFAVARVLLAREDHRALVRLGVAEPFRWGWGLIAVVYLIGRGVVLSRRTGHGTMLTWIGLAVALLCMLVDRSGIYDAVLTAVVG